jgi:hypothetical protein
MTGLWVRCWWELGIAAVAIRSPWRWRYLNPQRATGGVACDPKCVSRVMWSASSYHCKSITCLEYAAALHRLLKRRGVDCALLIGVRSQAQEGQPLDAHAWVELAGGTPLGVGEGWADYLPLQSHRGS